MSVNPNNLTPEQLIELLVRAYNALPMSDSIPVIQRARLIEERLAEFGYQLIVGEDGFTYEAQPFSEQATDPTTQLIERTGLDSL